MNKFEVKAAVDNFAAQIKAAIDSIPDGAPVPVPQPQPEPAPQPPSGSQPKPIDGGDVVVWLRADIPFSKQSGWSASAMGKYANVNTLTEAGHLGRITKVDDPVNPGKKVLQILLQPTDPNTSGAKRTECSCGRNVAMEQYYWVGFDVYPYEWGGETTEGLYGVQLHSGDDSSGFSPAFGLYIVKGVNYQMQTRSRNTGTQHHEPQPIKYKQWERIICRFLQSESSHGRFEAWAGDKKIADLNGGLGFNTGVKDYFKFGIYCWQQPTKARKILLRNPVVVLDRTGSTYSKDDISAFIGQ